MTCFFCCISALSHVLVSFTIIFPSSESAAYFTQVPPSKLYVIKGGTAKFVWDYHVDDRDKDFRCESPRWLYVNQNDVRIIGGDIKDIGWKFMIDHKNCPSRLLRPRVRVSKESNATLVITNVTMDDSGLYRCGLILSRGVPPFRISEVYLIVTDVMPHFTQVPPSILYVAVGQAVKFVWDYVTSNRTTDFDVQSPRWEFYTSKNGWETIGSDHGTSAWQWRLSPSCPARLQNPTRVSKASTASLVIYNVTSEDDGIYRCNLTLKDRPSISSTSRLVVTAEPQFTSRPPSSMNIAEGQNLQLLCSAIGPPTPNVTWVRVQGVSKVTVSQGEGKVSLRLPSISKEHGGKYECQAVNNPNLRPVTTQINIHVMYKPSIDEPKTLSTTVTSLHGARVTLRCMVSGFPFPNITWYKPGGEPIRDNVTSFPGVSEVAIVTKDDKDYGKYRVRVENEIGYSERTISVKLYRDDNAVYSRKREWVPIDYGSDALVISCIVIIVVLLAIVVTLTFVVFNYRRKAGSSNKRADEGFLNMPEIPVSSAAHNSSNDQSVNDLVYDEPGNKDMTSSFNHIQPYDTPEIKFIDGTSTSTSQTGHYQELNINNPTSRHYESLQTDTRAAVINPTFNQAEELNAYEPLRKKKIESHYQHLHRN